jgi:hypothetical protein
MLLQTDFAVCYARVHVGDVGARHRKVSSTSLTTRLGLQHYELMTSPSFPMTLFHRKTEPRPRVEATLGWHHSLGDGTPKVAR